MIDADKAMKIALWVFVGVAVCIFLAGILFGCMA